MTGSKIAHFGLARQYRNLKDELLDATDKVLSSGVLMSGSYTSQFEKWLETKTNCEFCITVHSGTQALEIIAQFMKSQWLFDMQDFKPSVHIPNISYPATLNAFLNADFEVSLVDTDKNGLIDSKALTDHPLSYRYICQVGLYGAPTHSATSNHIVDGAQNWLIADKSSIGMAMAISFDPTKNLNASGNGGAIVTNDRELYDFAYNMRNNGKPDGHRMSGTNSRLSELECAHLLVRKNHLDDWQWKRKQIRYYYLEQFKNLPITCLSRDFMVHADQKFVIYTTNRDALLDYLKSKNIEARIHYEQALSELPIAKNIANKPDMLSTSVMLTRGVLSLPIYPELADGEVEYIAKQVKDFFTLN